MFFSTSVEFSTLFFFDGFPKLFLTLLDQPRGGGPANKKISSTNVSEEGGGVQRFFPILKNAQ